jgi:hypothetical protein
MAKDRANHGGPMERTGFHRRGAAAAGCAVALLLCATAVAQEPATAAATESPAPTPAPPPTISYKGGQLKIDAVDASLADILTKVAAVTGVTIDVPPAASETRMAVVQLGPGPAREVLASLLGDSNVDYLIQASDTDPLKVQSVLVMMREKKGSKATEEVARAAVRSPYARRGLPPQQEETQPPAESPQPESVVAEPSAPAPTQPDPSAAVPPSEPPPATQSAPVQQPGMINGAKIAPQPVPSSLDSQNISQTLQQMYQQRMVLNQQANQASPQTMAPNPH